MRRLAIRYTLPREATLPHARLAGKESSVLTPPVEVGRLGFALLRFVGTTLWCVLKFTTVLVLVLVLVAAHVIVLVPALMLALVHCGVLDFRSACVIVHTHLSCDG